MAENRKFQREKRRISCDYRANGEAHSGIVSDLSARGLFVQSSAMPEEGAQLELTLHDVEHGEVALWGRVARTKPPHRSISNVVPGGFGVVVESAPEDFFDLLIALGLA